MKKAIVYIDLSERSKKMVEYVMHLRRFIPLEVHLVYNINIYDYAFHPVSAMGFYSEETLDTMVSDERNKIKQEAFRFIEESSCWGKTELKENLKIETGELFEEVRKLKNVKNAFVVVPEIDERIILDKYFNNEKYDVLEDLNIPVLIVPNDYHFHVFKSMIFVTNFHENDLEAIRFINKLALPINAPIHIIHVTDEKNNLVLGRMRQLKDNVDAILKEQAKSFSFEIIVSENFSKTIKEIAEKREAGLLVLQEVLLKLILGNSYSDGTMEVSNFPVLVFNK